MKLIMLLMLFVNMKLYQQQQTSCQNDNDCIYFNSLINQYQGFKCCLTGQIAGTNCNLNKCVQISSVNHCQQGYVPTSQQLVIESETFTIYYCSLIQQNCLLNQCQSQSYCNSENICLPYKFDECGDYKIDQVNKVCHDKCIKGQETTYCKEKSICHYQNQNDTQGICTQLYYLVYEEMDNYQEMVDQKNQFKIATIVLGSLLGITLVLLLTFFLYNYYKNKTLLFSQKKNQFKGQLKTKN